MKIPADAAFATRAIHAGQSPDPTTGAIMTPIYQTSTYVQDGPGGHKGFEYSRTQNPTRFALQDNLASLEGAKHGLCFASGCAATTAIALCLNAGDHVVSSDDLYGGTFRLFDKVFKRFGVTFTFVDMSKTENVAAAMQANTKLVWIETPTNPMLKLVDIAAVSEIAKKNNNGSGAAVAVDNTFATPYLQLPLALGATMVVHSTTKYLGGHSDVVGGAILLNDDEWRQRLAFVQNSAGGVPGPQDCFLVLRSTKTLHVRMQRHQENAIVIAEMLAAHPNVEKVYYPGLESHPQHALMKKQMKGPGAMISFVVKGGLESAKKLLTSTRIFACAESLGGVESLIEHPAIMTHASVPAENRRALGIDDGLIRVSVGIEDIGDLKADLDHALKMTASH
ncbi:MAG: cystathionine gamma-synthase [Deltaproteobacteria bacterium]|nr:cystathionine gamma-synthase [Deltaproteobacteria bacterium]